MREFFRKNENLILFIATILFLFLVAYLLWYTYPEPYKPTHRSEYSVICKDQNNVVYIYDKNIRYAKINSGGTHITFKLDYDPAHLSFSQAWECTVKERKIKIDEVIK